MDLHMNNILGTDRFYPTDLEYPHEYGYLVSDLGKGKVLSPEHEVRSSFDARASYGAVEFRAPEVQGSNGWLFAAEVFSFGVIASKIIQCRGYIYNSPPSERVLSAALGGASGTHHQSGSSTDRDTDVEEIEHPLPTALKDAIEPCLACDPADRPALKDVVQMLEKAGGLFGREDAYTEEDTEMGWTFWEWRESVRVGLTGKRKARNPAGSGRGSRRVSVNWDLSHGSLDLGDLDILDD
ncbi:hypothetical protein BDV19DRAFT_389394 [Aspergillus venezuelensis]